MDSQDHECMPNVQPFCQNPSHDRNPLILLGQGPFGKLRQGNRRLELMEFVLNNNPKK